MVREQHHMAVQRVNALRADADREKARQHYLAAFAQGSAQQPK
jgi:hypothetical protein